MSKKSRARAAAETASCLPPSSGPKRFVPRWGSLLAGGIIVIAAWAAYYNSFSGPFIFDDRPAITDNPTIRHLWSALSPPPSGGVLGRPLVNLSLALNYAAGGLQVWGYHVTNLVIHILGGLTLFGIVRRTLREYPTSSFAPFDGFDRLTAGKPGAMEDRASIEHRASSTQPPTSKSNRSIFPKPRWGEDATWLALAIALLWTVHPLQTESVTSIVQRTESLMGLFYLLTVYCFVRGAENQRSESRRRKAEVRGQISEKEIRKPSGFRPLPAAFWLLSSVFACALGMATKEVMVTAPLIVLLYDRTFMAGTFREAWRRRGRWHLGLFGTWLVLGALLVHMGGSRNTAAGFGLGITSWAYALTQCRAVVLYLKLAVWPDPLVFYYGTDVVQNPAVVAPQAILLALLAGGTLLALWKRPVLGFLGAWFFLILAPSSSVVPLITQTIAEHRMYLPLAAVVALAVIGLYSTIGPRSLIVFAAAAAGLGWLTVQRNRDYRSEEAIWSDTVAKRPDNARARSNLATVLVDLPGRLPDAVAQYEASLQVNPNLAATHYDLGLALSRIPGRLPDAMAEYRAALKINPDLAEAHYSLGVALAPLKDGLAPAITEFAAALRINPNQVDARIGLGSALAELPGHLPEAIAEYEAALQIKPDSAEAHFNQGSLLSRVPGRLTDAISEYEAALQIKPGFEEAHTNLGIILAGLPGRLPDAVKQFEAAARINPSSPETHNNLEIARQALRKLR